MTPAEFFSKALPYARKAASALNMPVSVVLSQWALESDYGNSQIARTTGNLAGIKYTKYAPASYKRVSDGSLFANYNNNLDLFTQDYTRVLSMNGYGYKEIRDAVSVDDTVRALSASQYDEGHYGGKGADLLARIRTYSLTQYDGPAITQGDTELKTFSVPVPKGSSAALIAGAVIVFGIMMLSGNE